MSTPVASRQRRRISAGRDSPAEVQRRLTAEYLPAIFYAANDERATQAAVQKLRDYLAGYRFPEDVEGMERYVAVFRKLWDNMDEVMDVEV